MVGRISRQGKKYSGRHTSFIAMAGELVMQLEKDQAIEKISAGIIKTNLPNVQGRNRIKILDDGACLLLRVRGNISQQEVRVYGDKSRIQEMVYTFADKKGIAIQQ